MFIEDKTVKRIKMGEKEVDVSEFGYSLRINLFQEHFGLNEIEVSNPLSKVFLKTIDENSKVNVPKSNETNHKLIIIILFDGY